MGQFLQNFVMPSVMAVNRLQMAIDAPEKYGVVAVGCELLQWYTSIEDDMEPIPVANHALAGSSTADLLGGISYQVPTHGSHPKQLLRHHWSGQALPTIGLTCDVRSLRPPRSCPLVFLPTPSVGPYLTADPPARPSPVHFSKRHCSYPPTTVLLLVSSSVRGN